ncbi:MAG: hypothetical protein RQ757_01130, partial [Pseudomonadales bacterium]|nr:hypothetical protein [Pseudomonadales bacterium]
MESSASMLLVAVRKAVIFLLLCSPLLLGVNPAQAQQSLLPGQILNPGERPQQRPEQSQEQS